MDVNQGNEENTEIRVGEEGYSDFSEVFGISNEIGDDFDMEALKAAIDDESLLDVDGEQVEGDFSELTLDEYVELLSDETVEAFISGDAFVEYEDEFVEEPLESEEDDEDYVGDDLGEDPGEDLSDMVDVEVVDTNEEEVETFNVDEMEFTGLRGEFEDYVTGDEVAKALGFEKEIADTPLEGEFGEMEKEILKNFEADPSTVIVDEVLYDLRGNPINRQIDGEMSMAIVPLEEILIPPRSKLLVDDLMELEESIRMWGLMEPLHVVPFEDKYILLHGYRRYLALRNLRFDVVSVVVDTTRPKEMIPYAEVIANSGRPYNFVEQMKFGERVEERQNSFSHETIESLLNLPSGQYLKSKYVESAKDQFPDIYLKVVQSKMTVDAAFKKIEKELTKGSEESNPLDELNKNGLEGDAYGQAVEEPDHVQTKGERHPLDSALRKYVEGRDNHCCQSCGMGLGEPDMAVIFHVHHMIPVKYGGPDAKGNLILLCPNCHGMVHAYEEGRFKPARNVSDSYSNVYNALILGNIVKNGLPPGHVGDAYEFYMSIMDGSWLEV